MIAIRFLMVLLMAMLLKGSISAQGHRHPMAGTYAELAAYSSKQPEVFSLQARVASLSSIDRLTGGVYSERRFMVEELSFYQLVLGLPTVSGNFGVRAGYFGNRWLNEAGLGLAYSRTLGGASVGAQFNYHVFHVSQGLRTSSVNFELGALFRLVEELRAGIHIYNPLRSRIGGKEAERLPVMIATGLGYDLSPSFFMAAEIKKQEDEPVCLQTGMQYKFSDKLLARCGVSFPTVSFYGGAGYVVNGLGLQLTISSHPYLGLTPGLALIYKAASR